MFSRSFFISKSSCLKVSLRFLTTGSWLFTEEHRCVRIVHAADHDQCSLITHTYARDRWWTAWDAWRSRSPETHRWELLQRKSVWGWWWGWWWGWRLTIRGAPGFSAIRDSSTSRSFLSWRSWWRKPFRSRWRNESFRDLQHTESIMGTRVRSTLMLSSQSQESAVFIAHVSPVTVMQRTTAFNSCWL